MRQGYPFLPAINIAARPNRAPAVAVLLDPVGDVRFPNFATMDFRVDRAFTVGGAKLLASFDVFNLFNANTVMGRLRIELEGNLAAMLRAAQAQSNWRARWRLLDCWGAERSPDDDDLVRTMSVAGARNQHYLQLWRPAA